MVQETATTTVEAKRARLRQLIESKRLDVRSPESQRARHFSSAEAPTTRLKFSFFFFESNSWLAGSDQYKLLFDVARFADEHGFEAVWTPERHFNSFGSPFPSPATLSAALAMITRRIRLRAGSVLLPLHHPARIAEDWAVVDNISGGRVDIAFAPGYHPNDFAILSPNGYESRYQTFLENFHQFVGHWQEKQINQNGFDGDLKTFPRPVQQNLPLWTTANANPESFKTAGQLGTNLLTAMLVQDEPVLAERIRLYREQYARCHPDKEPGTVTLMLHTFIGKDLEEVERTVRPPLREYIASNHQFLQPLMKKLNLKWEDVSAEERQIFTEHSVSRYMERSALIGTVEKLEPFLHRLQRMGVDEIACLIDFGVEPDVVLDHLQELCRLKDRFTTVEPQVTSLQRAQPFAPVFPGIEQASTPLPLSPGQAGMWLLQKLAPESSCYNQAIACRITQPAELSLLSKTFGELIARHLALSITVSETETGPIHWFQNPTNWLEVHDVSQFDDDQVHTQLLQHARHSFNLQAGPVFRVHLYTKNQLPVFALLVQHHLSADGYSGGLLFSEWQQLYAAAARGELPQLPPPGKYVDLIRAQQDWLAGSEAQQQLKYWRQQFAGDLPLLQLPTDRPHPATPSLAGDAADPIRLDFQTASRLRNLAKEQGATLTQLLLAAYAIFLHRYSTQSTIFIGLAASTRIDGRYKHVVGDFVNAVAIRSSWSPTATLSQFLRQLRDTVVAALAHGQIPFPEIVKQLGLPRTGNRTPVFQTMFSVVNESLAPDNLASSQIFEYLPLTQQAGQFDLNVEISAVGDLLDIEFRYDRAIFEKSTIQKMAESYVALLQSLLEVRHRPIGDFSLVTDVERRQLLALNETATPLPAKVGVVQLFEAEAARRPEAVAVQLADSHFTYGELNARANRLAHKLRQSGVGPDVLVGICLNRSFDMIVALLGVLKAGGAFVPLDPDYPVDRLSFMLHDASVAVIVTQQTFLGRLPDHPAYRICLDLDADAIASQSAANLFHQIAEMGRNPAYVIYTSGSTGKPKGVMIEHQALATALVEMGKQPGISPSDRWLAVTTISFDIAYLELFLPLTHGATIVLAEAETARDGQRLLQLLNESKATILQATPVTWRMLLASGWTGTPRLRAFCGGEALTEELARQLLARTAETWNMYGPTEATIWSSVHRLSSDPLSISIGRPLENTQYLVLDERRNLVPQGVPGELFIGGRQLARGYLHRPELTSERFIDNPFRHDPESRLYRTGDLCRWRPNGELQFLGRIDHQIKLRGYRIELGEIESALSKLTTVQEAVVVLREDHAGEPRLVAYVVPRERTGDRQLDPAAIRRHLQQSLPDYMVPAFFVELPSLPLTPNGKIDRRSLPAPAASKTESIADNAVLTSTEKTLSDLWCQVLGVGKIGKEDNFFDVGGHSLLVPQLARKIHEAIPNSEPLSVRSIFEHPTISQIARILDGEFAPKINDDATSLMFDDAKLGDVVPLNFESAEFCTEPRAVLLTSATGFFGGHLLHEYLQRTDAELYCLVRAPSEQVAWNRLEPILQSRSGDHNAWRNRIHVVLGDLSIPSLGLAAAEWDRLAAKLDVICHNGAFVNFAHTYSDLRKTNVEGTRTILRLAVASRVKTVLYVSTLGVLSGHDNCDVTEETPLSAKQPRGAYPQSKWVAERLIEQARERGLPVVVFRPGRITGDSVIGIPNSSDAVHLLVKASLLAGVLPDLQGAAGLTLDMTPVDYVCQSILTLSRRRESRGCCFHVLNPQAVPPSGLRQIAHDLGIVVDEVAYVEWLRILRKRSAEFDDRHLDVLLSSMPEKSPFRDGPCLRQERTAVALWLGNVPPPKSAYELLRRFVSEIWAAQRSKTGISPLPSREGQIETAV